MPMMKRSEQARLAYTNTNAEGQASDYSAFVMRRNSSSEAHKYYTRNQQPLITDKNNTYSEISSAAPGKNYRNRRNIANMQPSVE